MNKYSARLQAIKDMANDLVIDRDFRSTMEVWDFNPNKFLSKNYNEITLIK